MTILCRNSGLLLLCTFVIMNLDDSGLLMLCTFLAMTGVMNLWICVSKLTICEVMNMWTCNVCCVYILLIVLATTG
jgi:hypothetical protein